MPKYTVHFSRITKIGVEVTADDPDVALDLAYDALPSEPCAQCSGSNAPWYRAESVGDEFERITNESGAEVVSSGNRWIRKPEVSHVRAVSAARYLARRRARGSTNTES